MKDALVKIRAQLWDMKNQLSRVPEGAFSARQMAANVAAKLMDVMRGLDDLIENGQLAEPEVRPQRVKEAKTEAATKEPVAKKKQIYEVMEGNHGDR